MKENEFLEVIDRTPLVSIDLIIKNEQNEFLLGFRNNKPAQNYWFVPGGRILKNERIANAFERLIKNEIGVNFQFNKAKHFGLYEHFYEDNAFDIDEISTHYVVNAFLVEIDSSNSKLQMDDQHSKFAWFNSETILSMDDVHQYSKNYFIDL